MRVAIIGTGYVGLVTGTCLSDFGLSVICVDQDETKISFLNSGGVPIYEPNLENLIKKNVSAGRLTFTTDLKKAVQQSKVIFIAVGTPSNDDGSADLAQIEEVARQIATSRATEGSAAIPYPFDIVSNPEFLREGSAVYDFTHPDKIVIGTTSPRFLHPGPGYGGSCSPKDTEALYHFASTCGYDFKLLKGVISANKRRRELMVDKIKHHLGDLKGKTIGILGLAFKQNTDDVCQSPFISKIFAIGGIK